MLHFGGGLYLNLGEVLDKDPLFGRLLELHPGLDVLAEQVMNFLIIDFDKAATDEMGLTGIALGECHDLTEGPRNDTLLLLAVLNSHHGMRLATPGLPVRENRTIVPLEHIVDKGKGRLLVNEALGRLHVENVIESK